MSPNHTFSDLLIIIQVNIMPKPLTSTQRAIVETLSLQRNPQTEASCSVRRVKRTARYLRVFGTSAPPIT